MTNPNIPSLIEEFRGKYLKNQKICKACLLATCDYSTTGCPWYQDNLVLNRDDKFIDTAEQMIQDFRTALETIDREAEARGRNEAVDYIEEYGLYEWKEAITKLPETYYVHKRLLNRIRTLTNNE